VFRSENLFENINDLYQRNRNGTEDFNNYLDIACFIFDLKDVTIQRKYDNGNFQVINLDEVNLENILPATQQDVKIGDLSRNYPGNIDKMDGGFPISIIHYPIELIEGSIPNKLRMNDHVEINNCVQRRCSIGKNIGYLFYDNGVSRGSSGGLILNRFGFLIGINHCFIPVDGIIINVGSTLSALIPIGNQNNCWHSNGRACSWCRDSRSIYSGDHWKYNVEKSESLTMKEVVQDFLYGGHEIQNNESC